MKKLIHNIGILRTDRIGEVLLATSAASAIRRSFPDARVHFFVSSVTAPIVRLNPDINSTVELLISKDRICWRDVFNVAQKLRAFRLDAVVILNSHKILHLAAFMAGIPRRFGYARKWPFLLTECFCDTRDQAQKHELDYLKDFLRAFGLGNDVSPPQLTIPTEKDAFVNKWFYRKQLDYLKPFAVIHPCASNPKKLWGKTQYAQLIRKIFENQVTPIIIGMDSDRATIQELVKGSQGRGINAAGEFSLDVLAALLSRAKFFIGNDSGPMHMACACGTRVYAIFSKNEPGSNPVRWGPTGSHDVVFHELLGQIPCISNRVKSRYIANDLITPEDVWQQIAIDFNLK